MKTIWTTLLVLTALSSCILGPGTDVQDIEEEVIEDTDTDTDTDSEAPPDTAPDGPPLTLSTLEQSGIVTCASPLDRDIQNFDTLNLPLSDMPSTPYLGSAGLAVAELTGDAFFDIVLATQTQVSILRGTADGYSPIEELATVAVNGPQQELFGLTVFDLDDDADLDILVTGKGTPNMLLQNDGAGTFIDIIDTVGLTTPATHHSTSSAVIDWDGDGDLDISIAGHGWVAEGTPPQDFLPADPTYMFENVGGVFEDISDHLPQSAHDGYTFVPAWIDVDGDGILDLYMVNDFGQATVECQPFLNHGNGTFSSDFGANYLNLRIPGMGAGIGDFDGDGSEDLAIPAWNRNALMMASSGIWFNRAANYNFYPLSTDTQSVGWGTEMVDVNNDGRLDVPTQYGFLDTVIGENNGPTQFDALWLQTDDGMVIDVAEQWQYDDGGAAHRGAVWMDINRDGYLDVARIDTEGKASLSVSRCGLANWTTLTFEQPAPNRSAIGTIVELETGSTTQMRRLRAGGTGIGTSASPELHFGLGDLETIDTLRVTWPDGLVEEFHDIPSKQHLKLVRPEAP